MDCETLSSTCPRTDRVREPNPNDVICGRGGLAIRHEGNLKYRKLVESNLELYHASPKHKKILVAKSIVEATRKQHPPGRFLNKTPSGKAWAEIEAKKAIRKTSQTFRDITLEGRRKREEAQSSFSSLETLSDDEAPEQGLLLRDDSDFSSESTLESDECQMQRSFLQAALVSSSEPIVEEKDDAFLVQESELLLGREFDFADMNLDYESLGQRSESASLRLLDDPNNNPELELGQWLEQFSE